MQRHVVLMSLVLVSAVLLQTRVEAAVAVAMIKEDPNHPGKCYDKSLSDTAHAIGESWTKAGKCAEYTCAGKSGDTYTVRITGCGALAPPKGCKLETNAAETYPNCCPKVVCP